MMTRQRRRTATAKEALSADERAERLKERVYITFASLAVVLALQSHGHSTDAGEAAGTLLIAATGTLLAVFVADFISHLAVHQAIPARSEFRHMVSVTVSGLGVLPVPLIVIATSATDLWSTDVALRVSMWVLLMELVAIGYLAVRRVRMPPWQRAVVLGAEALLGGVVIVLEVLAHG